eukprot:TRINITY_DN66673_c8_g1_i1.p1 TRINITY_DN66673_c8_g1~~TRINITY_DN66673_c8_g1_i1.p1  ORF type:complete len:115 (-),score=11.32 TRINITY_DN66673_c8_g1_i1:336-680(-)
MPTKVHTNQSDCPIFQALLDEITKEGIEPSVDGLNYDVMTLPCLPNSRISVQHVLLQLLDPDLTESGDIIGKTDARLQEELQLEAGVKSVQYYLATGWPEELKEKGAHAWLKQF